MAIERLNQNRIDRRNNYLFNFLESNFIDVVAIKLFSSIAVILEGTNDLIIPLNRHQLNPPDELYFVAKLSAWMVAGVIARQAS